MILPSRETRSQFYKYCLVGASGVGVNYGVTVFIVEALGFGYQVGLIFGIGAAVLTNFTFNKLWTFKNH